MAKYKTDEISFLNEYARRLESSDRNQIPLKELDSFMEMNLEECKRAVAMLKKNDLVTYGSSLSVIITNAGHELIQHNFGRKIDYDRLVIALESVSASMADLTDVIQPLIDDIKAGKKNDDVTRTRLWDVLDRVLNSTVNVTTIIANARSIVGLV